MIERLLASGLMAAFIIVIGAILRIELFGILAIGIVLIGVAFAFWDEKREKEIEKA